VEYPVALLELVFPVAVRRKGDSSAGSRSSMLSVLSDSMESESETLLEDVDEAFEVDECLLCCEGRPFMIADSCLSRAAYNILNVSKQSNEAVN